MDKVIEILRRLADGARGPLVHLLIDELETLITPVPDTAPGPDPQPPAPDPKAPDAKTKAAAAATTEGDKP